MSKQAIDSDRVREVLREKLESGRLPWVGILALSKFRTKILSSAFSADEYSDYFYPSCVFRLSLMRNRAAQVLVGRNRPLW
jgi:hypothetical protein